MYFPSTRFHQEYAGGAFIDVIIDDAHDPQSDYPFKGNVDLDKLTDLIKRVGADKISYVSVAATVNMAGGQPISMANLREIRALCDKHGIPVMLDGARAVENAYFIQQREAGYDDMPVAAILKEFCSYTDGCAMSGKKDALVNIGGGVELNDPEKFEEARNLAFSQLVIKQVWEQQALGEIVADLTHVAMLRLAAVDFGLLHNVPAAAVGLQAGKVGGAAGKSGQFSRLIATVVLE